MLNIEDFIDKTSNQYLSFKMEDMSLEDFIDYLITFRLVSLSDISETLSSKYNMSFFWVKINPTPKELKPIADKYGVLLQMTNKGLYVFVPIGTNIKKEEFQLDLPTMDLHFVSIAKCNYKMIVSGVDTSTNLISKEFIEFRPKLIFRLMVSDCIDIGCTDMHFESIYINKKPSYMVRYRIKRELVESKFKLTPDVFRDVIVSTIKDLSPSPAAEIDNIAGLVTEIPDLFGDGSCEIRVTGMPSMAGLFAVFTIQTILTTTLKIDELGFPDEDVKQLREYAYKRKGLTLVTGEKRSGKNTTILAMVNEVLNEPMQIIEYSNPIEFRMPFCQVNYHGDIDTLKNLIALAKKQDIDLALINELPNSEVAFAVRDLVNSSIGVITTTHINRVWHIPYKLREFFGDDYKTVISQLNCVITQKMFRRWVVPRDSLQVRELNKDQDNLCKEAYAAGVRQYYVLKEGAKVKYKLQPICEIFHLTDEIKTAILNFNEIYKAEQLIISQMKDKRIENKLAKLINSGACSLQEWKLL